MKILLADDDLDILDVTSYALRREGFHVSVAADGLKAMRAWQTENPDVVLLDVRMPKLNGFELLRTIRQQSETPIIIVTARSNDDDVVRGLRLGADDYVTKPFSTRQLAERIRSVVRRAHNALPPAATELESGGLLLDLESHAVRRGALTVRLTPTEFRILHLLMLNAGRVVPSYRLVEKAWGYDGGDSRMLKTHISNLRKKLRLRPDEPGYIQSVPTVGYQLQARPESRSG
jgi:DNA-binding response OmpR family regulator